jgi:hypothetical protein
MVVYLLFFFHGTKVKVSPSRIARILKTRRMTHLELIQNPLTLETSIGTVAGKDVNNTEGPKRTLRTISLKKKTKEGRALMGRHQKYEEAPARGD